MYIFSVTILFVFCLSAIYMPFAFTLHRCLITQCKGGKTTINSIKSRRSVGMGKPTVGMGKGMEKKRVTGRMVIGVYLGTYLVHL